jgi:hypothetical protein
MKNVSAKKIVVSFQLSRILMLGLFCGVDLFLFSLSHAFATPAVGDYASYIVNDTTVEEHELVAFNVSQNTYQEKVTTTTGSASPQVQIAWYPAQKYISTLKMNQFMTACQSVYPNHVLPLILVPAGIIAACELRSNAIPGLSPQKINGTTWMGHVPFQIIKRDTTYNGQETLKVLKNYHFGAGSQ